MSVRFFFNGVEVTGPVPEASYYQPWYLFLAGDPVARASFERPDVSNLSQAIVEAGRMGLNLHFVIANEPKMPRAAWTDVNASATASASPNAPISHGPGVFG